jgi:hypothetical protein
MRVFLGGEDGVQVGPFKAAWTRADVTQKENWDIQYLTVNYINEIGWSEKDLIDWLLDSHVHFILSHVHQGIGRFLEWNMEILEFQLQRLKFHLGFPNLAKLKCPVFLQHKYNYLCKMPVNKVNNTLQLHLTDDQSFYNLDNTDFIDALKR